MGSRSRTTTNTTTTVVNAPTAAVVNVVSGNLTQVTNVVNRTTVVYRNPPAPPPQRVITSGNVVSAPSVATIGSTVVTSSVPDLAPVAIKYTSPNNVWTSVPFVSVSPVPTQVVTVVNNPSIDVGLQVADAQNIRADLCESLTTDPSSGVQDWTITGNGSATRFRFPNRGAPTNVAVVNLTSGATLNTDSYSVSVRGDSFSWLVFDTALSDGVSYKVTFNIGDSEIIKTVSAGNWRNWQAQIGSLNSRLNSIKTATSGTKYVGANQTTTWTIGDPTLVADAENALSDLQRAIKRPGMRMDVGQVAGICDYLERQLSRIENNLNKVSVVEGVRCGTTTVTVNTDSSIAGRIYQNDIRYTYFVGSASCASYRPPNATNVLAVCYRRQYDSATGRFYYST
jgi:hypothetical protein